MDVTRLRHVIRRELKSLTEAPGDDPSMQTLEDPGSLYSFPVLDEVYNLEVNVEKLLEKMSNDVPEEFMDGDDRAFEYMPGLTEIYEVADCVAKLIRALEGGSASPTK